MGEGKKLKEILDSKNTNVRQIAKATGISATTLYSIIQKDSNIRFDFALRLANELEIDVNEICAASPFSGTITEEEIYPTLPDGLNGALDGNRVKVYLKNSLYPLMYLFGKNSMPDVDNLLTSFYQLEEEARKETWHHFHRSSFLWHRFGTALHFFVLAKFQKGLPDFSESPIKSSFLPITQ